MKIVIKGKKLLEMTQLIKTTMKGRVRIVKLDRGLWIDSFDDTFDNNVRRVSHLFCPPFFDTLEEARSDFSDDIILDRGAWVDHIEPLASELFQCNFFLEMKDKSLIVEVDWWDSFPAEGPVVNDARIVFKHNG